MKNFIILVFVATLCFGGMSYAQAPDSCLRLYCVDGAPRDSGFAQTCYNPDSVKIDTCSAAVTYNQMYAKRWFYILFTNYVIDLPQAPADTILEVSWTDIDTAYASLRSAFAALETKYGNLYLKKYAPNWVDSTDNISHIYDLRFENYVCIDSVLRDLDSIAGLTEHIFMSYPKWLLSKVEFSVFNQALSIRFDPLSNVLILKRQDGYLIHQALLFDLSGRKLMEAHFNNQSEVILNISGIPNGGYLLSCDERPYQKILIFK